MTAVIEQTALCCGEGIHGSVALQTEAARRCLGAAAIDPGTVGLVVNAGVYRDDNIVEPAMATLVQQKLGLNLDPIVAGQGAPGTFAFDVANGACGVINAIQVAAAYVSLNPGRTALVLAGDEHPSKAPADDFPFTPSGAAALIAGLPAGAGDGGFLQIEHAAGPDGYSGLEGYNDIRLHAGDGRRKVSVVMDAAFGERLLAFAASTVNDFLSRHAAARDRLKLIASNPAPRFMERLAAAAGIPATGVVDAHAAYGDLHTASVLAGLHEGLHRGLVAPGDLVLLVCAGSGLTVSCALYRHGLLA